MMETEQPLYYHLHVWTIIFYLSLPLCGQLGSINPSVLFMLTSNLSPSFSLLTPIYLRRFHLYLLLWSVQRYIGPCGVLVPIGTVHSNNELKWIELNCNSRDSFECVREQYCLHLHVIHFLIIHISMFYLFLYSVGHSRSICTHRYVAYEQQ